MIRMADQVYVHHQWILRIQAQCLMDQSSKSIAVSTGYLHGDVIARHASVADTNINRYALLIP